MILKRIRDYFFQGLIYTAPIGITIYIINLIFVKIDNSVLDVLDSFNIRIPGLGIVLLLIIITFLGFLGRLVISTPLMNYFNHLLNKAPMFKVLYTSVRDFFSAFVGKDKKFNQPVLVKVNQISNLEKLGFITQEDLSNLGIEGKVAVYFPHSYAFSGELFIVPQEDVTPINAPSAQVMKFVVSGGVSGMEAGDENEKK
jgi:uncharacterized membrane protein